MPEKVLICGGAGFIASHRYRQNSQDDGLAHCPRLQI